MSGLIRVFSRLIGVSDISFGDASFSYVDEAGVFHNMQQLNATFIPYAVTQDNSGNVVVSGQFTVNTIVASSITLNTVVASSVTASSITVNGPVAASSVAIQSATITGELTVTSNVTVGGPVSLTTGNINVLTLPSYANNSAAISGGLTTGHLYRMKLDPSKDADPSCVCVVI